MAGPTVAFFGREDAIGVDFIVEPLEELRPGVRGELARVSLGVEAVGSEAGSKGPLGG
ncbi:MAG: hypothetical protein IIC94_04540 [Chloroflexi bacterium]|nr:hypothetical protein [Chloroflexota bacterium]